MGSLKGQSHEIFCFWFFSWISFPPAPEYCIRTVSNFFASQGAPLVSITLTANFSTSFPSVVDIGGKFATGVNDASGKFATGVNDTSGKQWEQLSNCWQFKMTWRKKMYLYVNFTVLPKGFQKKYWEIILIFYICHRCRWHRWGTLSCKYLHEFSKKIRNGPNGIIRGLGETDPCRKPEVKNLVALSL